MATTKKAVRRTLDARPDNLDFRDKMFVPTLCEVPVKRALSEYRKWKVPVLDQGSEGACTGFGLATVVNYLLLRRKIVPDKNPVSPRMLYEMARRYDEWPGEKYSGSSARGAMKGWHKHGICSARHWPYDAAAKDAKLNDARTMDAVKRPLGAYFRVNHKDLIAMHCAITEVGVLYATSVVHKGWDNVGKNGIIPFSEAVDGAHAFAIVAYDQRGFWIQNSWGKGWGNGGFALITYDDWLANGTDIWVARLGAPVELIGRAGAVQKNSGTAAKSGVYSYPELRPHIISIGNEGLLQEGGNYGTSKEDVATIFKEDFPRITKNWKKKRILLYAHGGLVSENAAVDRLADYRPTMLGAEVYPISFIWHSDAWSTITNILQDAFRRRRPEGFLDDAKDFMLDRLDDGLEILARRLTGKMQWSEMKENATLATANKNGGARIALQHIAQLAKQYKDLEIHIVGHSAGSIFHAPIIQMLTTKGTIASGPMKGNEGMGLSIASCTLWAPACTTSLFKQVYVPAIQSELIKRFALFTLTNTAERDDHCAHIYHKSLLYLVSNAFEEEARGPFSRDGEPILGMEKFVEKDAKIKALFKGNNAEWVLSPNDAPEGSIYRSTSREHGGFDDDKATVTATLGRILDKKTNDSNIQFRAGASALQDRRKGLANVK